MSTSYTEALSRLAAGDELTGEELLSLPGYDGSEDLVFGPLSYAIEQLPSLLVTVANLAKPVADRLGDDALFHVAEINSVLQGGGYIDKPLPVEVVVYLTVLGEAADLTLEAETLLCPR